MTSDFFLEEYINLAEAGFESTTPISDLMELIAERLNRPEFPVTAHQLRFSAEGSHNDLDLYFILLPWEDGTVWNENEDGCFPFFGVNPRNATHTLASTQGCYGLIKYTASNKSFSYNTRDNNTRMLVGSGIGVSGYSRRGANATAELSHDYSRAWGISVAATNPIVIRIRGNMRDRHNVYDISVLTGYFGSDRLGNFAPNCLIGSLKDTFTNEYVKGLVFFDTWNNVSCATRVLAYINNEIVFYALGNAHVPDPNYKRQNYIGITPFNVCGVTIDNLYIAPSSSNDLLYTMPLIQYSLDYEPFVKEKTITINGKEFEFTYRCSGASYSYKGFLAREVE